MNRVEGEGKGREGTSSSKLGRAYFSLGANNSPRLVVLVESSCHDSQFLSEFGDARDFINSVETVPCVSVPVYTAKFRRRIIYHFGKVGPEKLELLRPSVPNVATSRLFFHVFQTSKCSNDELIDIAT